MLLWKRKCVVLPYRRGFELDGMALLKALTQMYIQAELANWMGLVEYWPQGLVNSRAAIPRRRKTRKLRLDAGHRRICLRDRVYSPNNRQGFLASASGMVLKAVD